LCRKFIDLFPEHDAYLEPFAGGLSTLLNKPKADNEIACDLNSGLIDLFRDIRNYPEAFMWSIKNIEYSEHYFNAAKSFNEDDPNQGAFEASVAFLSRNRMSRGGLGKDFAWSDRLRGGQPGELNSWQTFIENDLPRIIERIRNVSFVCRPAINVIDECVSATSGRLLIYADPPYVHETRTHKSAYAHEMTTDDQHDLISCLKRASERGAKVFLSGYANRFYQEWIPSDWTIHRFDMPNHSGQNKTKQRRIEFLWESP
jgi:DNA adenine methylase